MAQNASKARIKIKLKLQISNLHSLCSKSSKFISKGKTNVAAHGRVGFSVTARSNSRKNKHLQNK